MSGSEIALLLIIGLLGGVVGGAFGVGGGIIIVPALILFMGFSQHQAQGTSLAVLVFPVAILGVLNYYKNGSINFKYALILMIAFFVGSYFGSAFAISMSEKMMKKIFGIFMLLVSLKIILGK